MHPSRKITAFLERWGPHKGLDRILVHHLSDRASVLDTLDGDDLAGKAAVAALSEQVLDSCVSHATAAGASQRYALMAVHEGGQVLGQLYVRIAPEAGTELSLLDPEPMGPASQGGALKQTLRHTEALMRMQLQTMGSSLGALVAINERLMGRLEVIENAHLKHLELNEQLLSRAHERDIAAADLRLRQERSHRLLQTADAVGGAMVARMTGATDVTKLLQSLDPEHREALFAALGDEQVAILKRIISLARNDDRLADTLGGLVGGLGAAANDTASSAAGDGAGS